jgi:hypothetical protein
VIQAARNTVGLTAEEILKQLGNAGREFAENARRKFQRDTEW